MLIVSISPIELGTSGCDLSLVVHRACRPSVLRRKSCYDVCGLYRFDLAQLGDLICGFDYLEIRNLCACRKNLLNSECEQ